MSTTTHKKARKTPSPPPAPQKARDTGITVLHLALGFAASMAAAGVFAKVWESVREPGGLSDAFDRAVLLWMHAHQTAWATEAAEWLAVLGSPPVIVGIAVGAALVGLLWRKVRGAAWTLPIGVIGAGLLIQGVKLVFRRPRPALFTPLLHETGFSFPSGHSLIAIVVYGLLGAFLVHLCKGRAARIVVGTLTVGLIVAIGASRVYVGVHYPTDVVAGWTAGLPWLIACLFIHERLTKRYAQAGEPVRDAPSRTP